MDYRIRINIKNFISKSKPINAYLYYSYIKTSSSISYNAELARWDELSSEIGDIAPHKLQFGVNVPMKKHFNLFVNGSYVSSKALYSRNPLRSRGEKLDGYLLANLYFKYHVGIFSAGLKVNNAFNKQNFHSGIESASAGDDFTNRSIGWYNSVLPQPGRSFLFNVTLNFK